MKIAVVENEEKDIQVYKEYISKYQESTKEKNRGCILSKWN